MSAKTQQSEIWSGNFGADYTERNTFDLAQLEEHYLKLYGVGRRSMNERGIGDIDRSISILEVGCNTGNQLLCLKDMGFENLTAIELQDYAITQAKERLPDVDIRQGSALELPFEDGSFDLVYTSGVLIHLSPDDVSRAMSEIIRVSCGYIWGFEYYERSFEEIPYRGHSQLMWKGPYAERYLELSDDLLPLRHDLYQYIGKEKWDAMFLLMKRGGTA